MALMGNSRPTEITTWWDYFSEGMPREVQQEAVKSTSAPNYFATNRVGTEAYLRSGNPVIAELGGESQDENWIKAEKDILEDRRELEIPAKDIRYSTIVEDEIPPTRVTALAVPEPEEERGGVIIEGKARETIKAALGKIGSGRERIRRFVGGLSRPGLRRTLTWLGLAAGALVVGYLGRDGDALSLDQAARVTEPPERGVVMPEINKEVPWDPRSVPTLGLAIPEARSSGSVEVAAGPNKPIKVDIPGRGEEVLNVRILTGNEPDIFNVPASPIIPDTSQAAQTGVSSADVRRVVENPQADDETAKMIRSYLNEETLAILSTLKQGHAYFPTKGPEGEKLKPPYASLKGWWEAKLVETVLGEKFDMTSPEHIEKLELFKKSPEYQKNWKAFVADQLLQTLEKRNKNLVGFLAERDEAGTANITDIIVLADNRNANYIVYSAQRI